MKIGVLTYHYVPNFGAQLQALSTIGFLRRMGHEPILLHWYPKDLERLYACHVPQEQIKCQMNFANKNYPLSNLCRTEEELIREIERNQIQLIITGSDALFKYIPKSDRKRFFSKRRLRFVYNYVSSEDLINNPFFCDYYESLTNKIPVVAFSVSSQSCPYFKMCDEEIELMKYHLKKFKMITVRDLWTKQMVEYVSDIKNIRITPDPVFAFNVNNYLTLPTLLELQTKFNIPSRYVLITFSKDIIEQTYIKELAALLIENDIVPIAFPEPEGLADLGLEKQITLPLNPLEWYALIRNSSGYIGTRMHPIIVCLHNAIPFFSFDGNGTRNTEGGFEQESSKVYDVLSKAGFESLMYALHSDLPKPSPIEVISKILNFDRNKCSEFSRSMEATYEQEMNSLIIRNS